MQGIDCHEETMTKRKNKKLTLKQARLVKELPGAASVSEAGRKAGYFDAPTAHRALASVREKMPDVLDRHGLTADFAAQKCLKLMDAKETKFFANQGIVFETREVEALDIQLRALDVWAKLAGAYTQKVEVSGNIQHGYDLSGIPDEVLHGIVGLAEDRSVGSGTRKG
jgi:hypothetical protein